MDISKAVERIAARTGAEALLGANVLVGIDRPIDEAIQHALALGPYHPGRPSKWSHCFLLAESFCGPDTRILDCTIRDPHDPNKLLFTETLEDFVKMLTRPAGGIYVGHLKDYDHPKVAPMGIKFIPSLSQDQRQGIVDQGQQLRDQKYSYDIPGLLRELIRLLLGVTIPQHSHMLFCSAFNQASYRRALGAAGDFNQRLADADTTPDDIWYSSLGTALA
jgi:hypothetical protein